MIFTSAAVIAGLYAFVCHVREERAARLAVRQVRDAHPAIWHSMHWFYRRVVSPSITIRLLRATHSLNDPHFKRQFDVVKHLARQKLIALGAAFLCIALLLMGSEFWGWTWH